MAAAHEVQKQRHAVTERRVHLYLARVVDELVSFEDALINTAGFFAREEHFEAKIRSVHSEFEATHRAQLLFSTSEAVTILIDTVTRPIFNGKQADEDPRRCLQNVFGASVLLSSAITIRAMIESPALITKFWTFLEQPAPLHPVQLQYWCRCAGTLLLTQPVSKVRTVLDAHAMCRSLLCHLESDAVCLLLKAAFGLAPKADRGSEGVVPLLTLARSGLLAPAVSVMVSTPEAALNVAELFSTICSALAECSGAPELLSAFTDTVAPALAVVIDTHLGDVDRANTPAAMATLRLAAAAMQAEAQCRQGSAEQHFFLPSALLPDNDAELCDGAGRHSASARTSFVGLVAPRLPALRRALVNGGALVQIASAELFVAFLSAAPAQLLPAVVSSKLIETTTELFFAADCNGGGRQDFLRHVLLRAFATALQTNDPVILSTLLRSGRLVSRLYATLEDDAELTASPEHARLLLIELIDASMLPSVAAFLAECPDWLELRLLAAPPTVLRRSSRASSSSCSGRHSPVASRAADAERNAANLMEASVAAESENINPNSPPPKSLPKQCDHPLAISPESTQSCGASDTPPLLVVCDESLRNADDFSKLTPRPMMRRTYLHRDAKCNSPFGRALGDSPIGSETELDRTTEMDVGAELDDEMDELANNVVSKLQF